MKKFSNITESKSKVSKSDKNDQLKSAILKLMDNYLTIRSYGSARTELLNGALAISGKEMFAEALINLINDKSVRDQIKSLESLKSITKDWQSIDSKIDKLLETLGEKRSLKMMSEHANKIKSLIKTYGENEDFEFILETQTLRLKDGKEAYLRHLVADKMIMSTEYEEFSKSQLTKISNKFLERSKYLGFIYGNN